MTERYARRTIALRALATRAKSCVGAVSVAVVRLQGDNRSVLRSSELVLAQLARGPPRKAWEIDVLPTFVRRRVGARKILRLK